MTIIYENADTGADWYVKSDGDAVCDDTKEKYYFEDGSYFRGYPCRQRLCIGSPVDYLQDDPHVQVCNENNAFIYSTERRWADWTTYFAYWG